MKKPAPLTDFDLLQMDEDWLRLLTPEQLQLVSERLLRELKETRDRLNQSPSNSSKPPSTRAPWTVNSDRAAPSPPSSTSKETPASPTSKIDSAPATKLDESASTTAESTSGVSDKPPAGKKAGKQPGAKGIGRMQKLAITDTDDHFPDCCAVCGQGLTREGAQAYTGWDEIDIAEKVTGQIGLSLQVTRHRLYAVPCACGHVTRAAHHVAQRDQLWDGVQLGEWRLVGPRLAGAIVFLSLRMRLSRARIREFFIELFDLQLSTGVLDETIREAGRAVAPLEDEMVREIEEAALLHADETPWKEAGKPLWLWVFAAAYTTLFFIGSRSLEILSNVLTSAFKGQLMTDGYLAYRHLGNRLRCWAHLLRKVQGLAESTDARVVRAGKSMQDVLCTLMEAIYLARATAGHENGALASQYAVQITCLRTLCEQHKGDSHGKLRSLAVEFLLDWDVILRQVSEPHLPLTNNAAEQALRHWVIARRISYGTRSEAGTRAFALLASVIETCRKRTASSWTYIATVIAAARKGVALPSLPPIPSGT
jgi:transposase